MAAPGMEARSVIPDPVPSPLRLRLGGLAWLVGAVQFVVAMAVTQLAWTTPYSLLTNAVSDLGAVTCHENPMGTSYVCSPLHALFNGSIIVFGALVVVGTWAVRPLLPRGRVATAGAALLVVAGLGAGIVGLFPEDTVGVAHGVGALLAFVGSAGALAALGIAMNRDPRWAGYEALTSGCGAISTGVLVTSLFRTEYGPLGFGGTERLLLAPALLWLAIVGARLVWKPRLPGPTTHG